MNSSTRGLTACAVACLREVIFEVQQLPAVTRVRQQEEVERLVKADLWPSSIERARPHPVIHRLTIGPGLPSVAMALLARTSGMVDAAAQVRLIRSTAAAVLPVPWLRLPQPERSDGAVRSVPLELPLMVINHDVAVLAELTATEGPPGLLVVRDEHAVNALVASHDLLWSATHVDTSPPTAEPLPPYLREIVAELATGVTDAAAARNLHVSERTVSRRVGEILDRLGATSRFQAGVVAARSGLLWDLASSTGPRHGGRRPARSVL